MSFLALGDFFQYSFLMYALIATVLLSVVMGLISPIVVVKRYSFIGSAISHSTLLGLAIASVLGFENTSLKFLATALIITLLFAMILAKLSYHKKLPTDSLIGIFFSATMSAGILIQNSSGNTSVNLFNYLLITVMLQYLLVTDLQGV